MTGTPEITYTTPTLRMIGFAVVTFIAFLLIARCISLFFAISIKLLPFIIAFVIAIVIMRHKVILGSDYVQLHLGGQKKKLSFTDTTFRTSVATGPASWFQSFGPRTNRLHIFQEGQKEVKMPVNISQADFEAFIAGLKERGAKVEAA